VQSSICVVNVANGRDEENNPSRRPFDPLRATDKDTVAKAHQFFAVSLAIAASRLQFHSTSIKFCLLNNG